MHRRFSLVELLIVVGILLMLAFGVAVSSGLTGPSNAANHDRVKRIAEQNLKNYMRTLPADFKTARCDAASMRGENILCFVTMHNGSTRVYTCSAENIEAAAVACWLTSASDRK